MKKISVAMTTYNGEKYISEQMQSLLLQTRQPDEVVICDDASTDATAQIVRDFIQCNRLQNWRVIRNSGNLGFVENYRKAIRETTGDYIFLCDQDDIWRSDKIDRMTSVMEEKPEIKALVCGYSLIDDEGKLLGVVNKKFYIPPRGLFHDSEVSRVKSGKILYSNMAQGCTGLYRRELVDSYRDATECKIIPHDWALNMLAYQNQGLYFLDRELVLYRIHPENTTGVSDETDAIYRRIPRLEEYAACIEDALRLPLPPVAKEEIKRIIGFTKVRIQWLNKRKPNIWFLGLIQYFSVIIRCFFWQYLKDLALIVFRKIPVSQDQ